MGKSIDNLFADGFTGKIGKNMVFRQKKSGTVIVAKSPRKTRNPVTEESLKIRSAFKEAVKYARAISKNPVNSVLKDAYQAAIKRDETAYNLALRDAVQPPKVTALNTDPYTGAIGSTIAVKATDDFKVSSVKVSIHAANGILIEEGNAVLNEIETEWIYTATILNEQVAGTSVTATAFDHPGNKGAMVAVL